jgi:hypothetical protein
MIYIPFIGLSFVGAFNFLQTSGIRVLKSCLAILIIGGLVVYSMKRAAAPSAATVLPVVAPAPGQAYRTDTNMSGATLPAYMPVSWLVCSVQSDVE